MKRMIMLFGWMLIVCTVASGQTRFLEQVDWGTPSVVKQGENVRVKVDIRLDEMRLKIQQALRLVPVIVSADGSQEAALQPVVIEGRVRFRVTERKQALGTWEEAEGTVHLWRENGKEQTVPYWAEVPFADWMVNGHLEIRGYMTNCPNCHEGEEVVALGEVLKEADVKAKAKRPRATRNE